MFNDLTWKESEQKVQEYMKKYGYKILMTNFSCVGVELDIVAILPKKVQIKHLKQEYKTKIKNAKQLKTKQILKKSLKNFTKTIDDLVVITEVKARRTGKFGTGADAVNDTKQMHIN
jgi:Holliday junction resolvase-like predicted endonuclease